MYYIAYGLLYLLSLTPWFIMYGISDFLAFLAFRVVGYRKQVVLNNLAIAFPEKSEEERGKIAAGFYRNFTDTLVETIKLISLSEKQVRKRYRITDVEMVNRLVDEGRHVQIQSMHNFNWEFVNLNVSMQFRRPFIVVYMPIANRIFDRLLSGIRSRYGTVLIPATTFRTDFLKYKDKPYILTLVGDQRPGSPGNAYWLPFFNRLTPFVTGPEKGARINHAAVVFGNFYPYKRGHYTIDIELISLNAADLPEHELTRRYVAYVEKKIRQNPSNYLWSHKRWKHEFREGYEVIV